MNLKALFRSKRRWIKKMIEIFAGPDLRNVNANYQVFLKENPWIPHKWFMDAHNELSRRYIKKKKKEKKMLKGL